MNPPSRSLLLALALAAVPSIGKAAIVPSATTAPLATRLLEPVRYTVSFENRAHHEARITIRYADLQPGPLELRMSRTSPGRYALHEFAKNVYDVVVEGRGGRPVEVTRPDPHQWTVRGHGGEVTVRYTLFADRADGTYSQVDRSHAHLNVPATFMFARHLFERPVELMVEIPEGSGWEVATQLVPTDDATVFTAPDHHYFMDSPLEIAELDWREWTVQDDSGPLTIRVAMHHLGTGEELDRYAAAAQAVAAEYAAVYGTYPDFDFGTYTFLACYTPWSSGDGMEHRNSTVLTSGGSLERSMTGLLGTVAHEFFHAWSIERIRPASLEPFDFEEANMSRELWFGEGFTSYYDDLALVRAGVIDDESFVRRVGGSAAAATLAPGRRFFSPVAMSMQAPFVDAATSVDPTNRENTFLSYYTWGAAVGLGLDLTLRVRGQRVTLDDLMREMWVRHGDPERPYTVEDVEAALAAVTGDPDFARDFFDRFVRGREVPDYPALFASVGVDFGPAGPRRPWLTGAFLDFDEQGARVAGTPRVGDPLYTAGVGRGDVITAVDGRTPDSRDALRAALESTGVGGQVVLDVQGRGHSRRTEVTLVGDPTLTATLDPAAGAEAAARRARWTASRAGGAP